MPILKLITAERRNIVINGGYFKKVKPGEEITVSDAEAETFLKSGEFELRGGPVKKTAAKSTPEPEPKIPGKLAEPEPTKKAKEKKSKGRK